MRKSKLGCILAYSAVFCTVGVVAGNKISNSLAAEDSPSIWGHYLAVAPTVSKAGCNEYWVECGTNIVSLSEPSATIEDRGTPSDELIETFSSYSDGRYIPKLLSTEGGYAYLGEYPQTIVSDSEIISAIANISPDSRGYRYYQGNNYVYISATPYNTNFTFTNGTTIISGNTYCFKVEPIKWKILSSSGSAMTLMTDTILDSHAYATRNDTTKVTLTARDNYDGNTASYSTESVTTNNYKYSEIRRWLNEEFIYKLGISYNDILTTEVNNGASTTNNSVNVNACVNTYDKAFLLSYEDYNGNYGFTNETSRTCQPTDYARATGTSVMTSPAYKNNATYLTRSPYSGSKNSALSVNYSGALGNSNVGSSFLGVRFAIQIKTA